jgi:hypothetical protein
MAGGQLSILDGRQNEVMVHNFPHATFHARTLVSTARPRCLLLQVSIVTRYDWCFYWDASGMILDNALRQDFKMWKWWRVSCGHFIQEGGRNATLKGIEKSGGTIPVLYSHAPSKPAQFRDDFCWFKNIMLVMQYSQSFPIPRHQSVQSWNTGESKTHKYT